MPKVFKWKADLNFGEEQIVNCDSIIEISEWAKNYGTNRLSNDVGLPLERAVIGLYQIAYLPDYFLIEDVLAKRSYFSEGITSILFHCISAYEMTGREFILIEDAFEKCKYSWKTYCNERHFNFPVEIYGERIIGEIALKSLKFVRFMLYNHMKRTKRFDETEFKNSLRNLVRHCIVFSAIENLNLQYGFELTLSKLQDQEISRH